MDVIEVMTFCGYRLFLYEALNIHLKQFNNQSILICIGYLLC